MSQQLLAILATNRESRKLPSTHPHFVFSQPFESVSQGFREDISGVGTNEGVREHLPCSQELLTGTKSVLQYRKHCLETWKNVICISRGYFSKSIRIQDLYIIGGLSCLNDHWRLKGFWCLWTPAVSLTYWLLWEQIFSAVWCFHCQ